MKPFDNLSDDEFAHLVQCAVHALLDAPPEWVSAATDLWTRRQATPLADAGRAALRLVMAVLSFDSWATPPAAPSMRGGTASTRHLLFSAQGRDIDLRISRAAPHYALTGQILGPDESGSVEMSAVSGAASGPSGMRTVLLDAMGEFRIDDVGSGTYALTLRVGDDEIVLPQIQVGE